jgi:23S rRNA (guanosine2251-2'-O)-methyltransferase
VGEGADQWIWGVNAVREALAAGLVTEVRAATGLRGAPMEVVTRAREEGVRVQVTEARALDGLVRGGPHQGVAARLGAFPYVALDTIVDACPGLVLVLDCIQDPRNLGAILRTAGAAGVEAVLIPKDRAAAVTPSAVMSAAGHAFRVPVARVSNLVRSIGVLKASGAWAVGLNPQAQSGLFDLALPERVILVAGGEGEGMRPLVQRTCDFVVSLPMASGVESLNASVAVGVALYEIVRQRAAARAGGCRYPGRAPPGT